MALSKNILSIAMITGLAAVAMLLTPYSAHAADSISVDSVSPALDADITPTDNKGADENFYTFWFKGDIGKTYTATFDVSEQPAMTFVSGGMMTLEDNISYDAATKKFTVKYTAVDLQQIDGNSSSNLEDGQTMTIIAVSFPVEKNGPGEDMIGSWMSSHFQEWALILPKKSKNEMGATLGGDPGDTGTFKMFVPTTALDKIAKNDNQSAGDYTAADVAIFEGSSQVSGDVKDVDGGVYVNFDTTLPESSTEKKGTSSLRSAQDSRGTKQSVTIKKRSFVSLIGERSTIPKTKYVKLTGMIGSGQEGKTVVLKSLTSMGGKYKTIATTKTKTGGKFTFRVRVTKSARFVASYRGKQSKPFDIMLTK
jgi:hypothetical protein